MVTRINPGINAHDIHPGVVLSTDEWDKLVAPLGLSASHRLDEVVEVLVGRVQQSYNVAHLVRELINAGCGGQSVPPTELPEQIRKLGEAKRAAEHQARTFAGELADLTDRLERILPGVHAMIVTDLASDYYQYDDSGEGVERVACSALSIALRLLDAYDIRDREPARPVTRLTDPTEVRTLAEFERLFPGARVKVDWHDDPAHEPHRFTVTVAPPQTGVFVTEQSGPPTPGPAVPVVHNVYGVPITDAHPAVVYLAEHLGDLRGCSGTPDCKRHTVARALLDAAVDLGPAATSLSGTPLDRYTMRCAEHLADLTLTLGSPDDGLQTLANLCRLAWEHAARLILDHEHDPIRPGT